MVAEVLAESMVDVAHHAHRVGDIKDGRDLACRTSCNAIEATLLFDGSFCISFRELMKLRMKVLLPIVAWFESSGLIIRCMGRSFRWCGFGKAGEIVSS